MYRKTSNELNILSRAKNKTKISYANRLYWGFHNLHYYVKKEILVYT